jgi:hypothetical protein
MKSILNIILSLTTIAGICMAGFIGFKFLELREVEVINEARYQCAESFRYQITDGNGGIIWYPAKELYYQCLKEKGL